MKNTFYFFGFILLLSCGKKPAETQTEEPLAVTVTHTSIRSEADEIVASGLLSSKSELKLAFKTGGVIKRMYATEGQSVKAGQLLAELDMSEIDAQVNQAKLGLQKAQRDLERVKRMFADEVATQATLDDATTGYEIAQQMVQTATFNQKLSRIYAPQSGQILRKLAEQGELITPFAPAFILGTGPGAFMVNIGLADKEVVKIKKGDKATISLDAYPGERFSATVTQIAQVINPQTGTFEVELALNAPGKKLISGFVATAQILPPGGKSFVGLPISCLVEGEGSQAFVFVYQKNKVKKTPVSIGEIKGEYVSILNGITVADMVVERGANFLSDGQAVKVINQ